MAALRPRSDSELPVEPVTFLRDLHDALAHLHDLSLQRTHPLCELLNGSLSCSPPVTPARLRDLLLETIEQLKPSPTVAPDSPRWRPYHYLKLRYLDGARPEQVSEALGVGGRQSRRAHRSALRELATVLLDRASVDRSGTAASVTLVRARPDSAIESPPVGAPDAAGLEAELARLEEGQVAEPIDARIAVDDALRLASPFAVSHSVTLESVVDAESPALMAARIVLRQALLSVMNYFIRLDGARRITISAVAATAGADLCIQVSRRQSRPSTPLAKDGLAAAVPSLAMTSRLLEGQEGVFRLEASASGDLAAHLWLPTVDSTLVLVVDDNPDMAQLFGRFLRGAGYRLTQARTASAAFEIISTQCPDVIILDLLMPIRDGWDIFQQLRDNPATASIPIIACSIVPELELAASLGVNGILTKPVTPDALRSALAPHRRGSRA